MRTPRVTELRRAGADRPPPGPRRDPALPASPGLPELLAAGPCFAGSPGLGEPLDDADRFQLGDLSSTRGLPQALTNIDRIAAAFAAVREEG